MRNAVLVLAMLLAGAATLSAQNAEWADKLFAKAGTTHNFGNVPRGAVLSYRFPLTNIYAVPLEITGTRVSCGCVTVTPSASKLQPKESGYIDIVMDARRFTGAKTVSIYVTVGPQYTSTATLQVSANSRTDVVFNPGQVNFGVVAGGQTPAQTIDVEYAGTLDWRITGIAQHSYPLDVQTTELYRRTGQVGYRLQVTLKANAPGGAFKHELFLQTNDPASLLVPVLVEGTVQAPLSVAPAQVKLAPTPVGKEISTKVLVVGSKPFRVTSVEGLGDGLTADLPPTADTKQIVTLKWRPTKAGDVKRELRFLTDIEGNPSATVTVEGTSVP
jgi:uncharacterized protein DUF1573